ncbi:hypothetical protein L6269_00250 [Candidatus Dependentiae bacterium]|nr:hypothetical protein [Candidatus Dependentiae bacterium]MCG2755911.1 hypothetical protein [Candidatus Dependentiae bacterium]
MGNQILLIKTLSTQDYGLMASIFSIIYLTIYISEFGISQSVPVFINLFLKNKFNFKKLLYKIYLLPQVIIFIIAGLVTTLFYKNSIFINTNSPYLLLIPVIILFEGIRIFLRRFLHTIFLSKQVVIVESILMILFLSSIWAPYFFFNQIITLNLIFISFLINSILALICFMVFIKNYQSTLPNIQENLDKKILHKIFKSRFLNYFINLDKNFFTGNFLTPFFASNFGMLEAGIFNLANHIAESIKAITKSTVIFSGGSLFAKLKSKSLRVKRTIFKLICENINKIIYPIVIFIVINNKLFFGSTAIDKLSNSIITLTGLFFLITCLEYFFTAYEQFFVIEEKTEKLLLLKLFEFLMFYIVINFNGASILTILLGLLITKLISFAATSLTAFYIWQLKPSFKISLKSMLFYFFLSLLIRFLI